MYGLQYEQYSNQTNYTSYEEECIEMNYTSNKDNGMIQTQEKYTGEESVYHMNESYQPLTYPETNIASRKENERNIRQKREQKQSKFTDVCS